MRTFETHENIDFSEIPEKNEVEIKSPETISVDDAEDIFNHLIMETYDEGSLEGKSSDADEVKKKFQDISIEEILSEIYDCDEDEFEFDQYFDFNDPSLETYLKYFDADKWSDLSVEDKKSVITAFAAYTAKQLGIENPPRIVYYYGPQNEGGSYNFRTNVIKVNLNNIDDSMETLNTISHETWHAYQFERANNPQTKKDLYYAYNFMNYVTVSVEDGNYVNFEQYESQLVEAEARGFANKMVDKAEEIYGRAN